MKRAVAAALVAVVVLALGAAAFSGLGGLLGPGDYSGGGSGSTVVQVPEGADGQRIAQVLADAGVVASAEAFYRAALDDSRSTQIRPGSYRLRQQMSAAAALDALLDPANRADNTVTIIEGSRVSSIVKTIAGHTPFSAEQVTEVLDNPKDLGLPAPAQGNPEGYLFPATYVVDPGMSVTELLREMVAKTTAVAQSLHIEQRAKKLGLSYEQALTLASILEWESNGGKEDSRKIARVFYNRLKIGMALNSDATVSYANKTEGEIWTTPQQRANPSAYNTYQHPGLPPGPIGSPGEAAIEAALNPAKGDWLYFTLLNLETGKTAFATNLADHEKNVDKFRAYCRTHEGC